MFSVINADFCNHASYTMLLCVEQLLNSNVVNHVLKTCEIIMIQFFND